MKPKELEIKYDHVMNEIIKQLWEYHRLLEIRNAKLREELANEA